MSQTFHNADLLDPKTNTENPWPLYTWLREQEPLFFDKNNEIYAVSRYDDVLQVSKDHETFISGEGARPKMPGEPSMIHTDGHAHSAQRGLVAKGFTPKRITQLESHIRTIVTELIDAMLPKGRGDLVADLACPLPSQVIGDMRGHSREEMHQLQEWTDVFVQGGCGPQYVTDEVDNAFEKFMEFHERAMEGRQRSDGGGDDLLTLWLHAEIDGIRLQDYQILFEHVLLLVGGSETTRNAISSGLEALMAHPDQWQYLVDHPESIDNAVEEIVRYTSPFVNMARTTSRDVEMHGVTIPAGSEILMLYPPANYDPRHFEEPHQFDVQREFVSRPLAFGYGKHICLGAPLARLEIRVVLEEVLARFSDMRIVGEVVPQESSFIRGPKSMPIAFTPSHGTGAAVANRAQPSCPHALEAATETSR